MFFDDFRVQHIQSPVVQMDDYYPFGLTFNSHQREKSVKQRYKFQGQEHIDDLGLSWISFKWRNHMPDIGRFFNVDPLAESFDYNSPYAFSENKVTSHIELEGLEAVSAPSAQAIVKQEIEKIENAVMPVVNRVTTAIGNGIDKVANMFSLGDDRGGFALTGTGMASHPLPDVRGRVDDNSLVDLDAGILDIPGFRGPVGELVSALDNVGDLHDAIDGSGIGVLLAPKKETITIENVTNAEGEEISLDVTAVTDTVGEHKNFNHYRVTLPSGKDSVIQRTNNPEVNKDE